MTTPTGPFVRWVDDSMRIDTAVRSETAGTTTALPSTTCGIAEPPVPRRRRFGPEGCQLLPDLGLPVG
jgi:hypothetical protein